MLVSLFIIFLLLVAVLSFAPSNRSQRHLHQLVASAAEFKTLFATSEEEYSVSNQDDDDEQVEPGKMRVSEIKAELDLREVSYKDCFDKESLIQRLNEARATGKASPKILEKFNRQKIEQTFKEEKLQINDDDIRSAMANDGTLPGGMRPDQFKKLVENEEVMAMLSSSKVQEAMQVMMTGGRGELEDKLKNDPELVETITKLNNILRSVQ